MVFQTLRNEGRRETLASFVFFKVIAGANFAFRIFKHAPKIGYTQDASNVQKRFNYSEPVQHSGYSNMSQKIMSRITQEWFLKISGIHVA